MRRNLGKMRHQLQVKAIARTRDAGGGYARSDTGGTLIWARVRTLSAREQEAYRRTEKAITHSAIIRRQDALQHGQTLVWKRPSAHGGDLSLYLDAIEDADPDHPGEFQKLLLREGGRL